MKTYEVDFGPQARQEAIEIAKYIAERAPGNAAKWLEGLQRVVDSLHTMPGRCGLARESKADEESLRQYIYHSHRIIFYVDEENAIVRILHIRHASMQPFDTSAADEES